MRLPAFVCLLARLLKNACMDLDELLRVDRCRDMTNSLTFEPDPDYSPNAGTGLLSTIQYALQRGLLLRWENPTYTYWRQSLQRCVVLKWFYSLRAVVTTLSEVRALHRVRLQLHRPSFFIVHRCMMMMMPTRIYAMQVCLLQVPLLVVCFYLSLQRLL